MNCKFCGDYHNNESEDYCVFCGNSSDDEIMVYLLGKILKELKNIKREIKK